MANACRVYINGLEYYATAQEYGKDHEVVDLCILDCRNHWQKQVGTQKQIRLDYVERNQSSTGLYILDSVSDCAGTNKVLARFVQSSKR